MRVALEEGLELGKLDGETRALNDIRMDVKVATEHA